MICVNVSYGFSTVANQKKEKHRSAALAKHLLCQKSEWGGTIFLKSKSLSKWNHMPQPCMCLCRVSQQPDTTATDITAQRLQRKRKQQWNQCLQSLSAMKAYRVLGYVGTCICNTGRFIWKCIYLLKIVNSITINNPVFTFTCTSTVKESKRLILIPSVCENGLCSCSSFDSYLN